MILCMGVVVGFIVLAILLPILEMSHLGLMMNKATSRLAPHDSRGFTLIEVMVLDAILAILATIIVPRIMGRPEEAKRTKAQIDIKSIEEALNLYKLDNGVYPTTEQGLEAR